ncbi:MAG: hypothetical protein JSV80_00080 [Acidobacteriota bacterium]|nr:MAG: hypothetical protein JSV80_00080 [Acidobacteriota bacterium]
MTAAPDVGLDGERARGVRDEETARQREFIMRRFTTATVVLVLWFGLLPVLAAEDQAPELPPLELACLEEYVTTAPSTPVKDGDLLYPGTSCYGKTFDDDKVEVGGSCSWSSQLEEKKCVRSCDGKIGQVVATTCVICPAPGPIIEPCQNRTSYHCVLRPKQ